MTKNVRTEVDINPVRLLLGESVEFDDIVSIKVPTVREVIDGKSSSLNSYIFNVSTRELFSASREVDELEKRYPTVWEMMFDEENGGDFALGRVLGIDYPASALVMECFEYWTGLDKLGFKKLLNGKIIHEESGWIVDKMKFKKFCEAIRKITCYEPNEDFIAPKNMTDARFNAWSKILKHRLKAAQRKKGNSLVDKILILQASFDSYVSIEEIVSMSYFQFNKLFKALNEKEGYLRNWEIMVSPKFDSSKTKLKHWTEKVHV
ncbi:hypothetical protein [Vagococcus fluvialis]|uniref:hypothetical protein n=1 Tax=Vagococcus fluvialis TaxID=2738 RepID=UPI001D0AFE51|nr:hypothetical protein [Vagococcus fluvialis]UDM72740.1 hypothetical protein K5L00_14375 [Vagococcus fluvialis]UDM78462.1 hypothetical protein K5K98_14580 [Vagococcus fluvialis]UDM84015.1 hypothetical protein K5K96_14400 [Vagococcus fluvialis]